MAVFFEKLFNMNIKHDFFEDGIGRDIKILPTQECIQLIRGGRMLFKDTDSGFKVLYKATDSNTGGGTPLVDLASDVKFTFALYLSNAAEFLNITDLDAGSVSYSKGKILHFKNNGTNSSLDYSIIDLLKPQLFTYEFPIIAADPTSHVGTLDVTDKNGSSVTMPGQNGLPDVTFPITPITPDENGVYTQPIDFRFLPKGKYTFKYSDNTHAVQTQEIYIDSELAGKQIFGLLEVDYLAANLYSSPEEYNMAFTRNETQWKFFVVVKTPDDVTEIDLDDLEIKDESNDPSAGNPYDKYDFTNIGSTTVNGFKTAILTSDQTDIPFFEIAKLRLELEHDGDTLIKNLPNPPRDGPSGPQAEIFVYI